MEWFWQGVTTNILSEVLIVAIVAFFAWAKTKNFAWVNPVLYGLAIAALILGITLMLRTWSTFSAPATSIDTVEADVRRWLDTFSLSVAKEEDPEAVFVLAARYRTGGGCTIRQLKKRRGYLIFNRNLILAPEHVALLAKQPRAAQNAMTSAVTTELAKLRIIVTLIIKPGTEGELGGIIFTKRLPIDSTLNESSFMERFDEMEFANEVARQTVIAHLIQSR